MRPLTVLLVALVVPAVALASGWRIVGQGKASGSFTEAAASASVKHPAALEFKVTASPNIHTDASYTIQCTKGSAKGHGKGSFSLRTPFTKPIKLPLVRPDKCLVVADATLPHTTRMTVTILAR
jgi:hypothetical protein